MLGDKWKALSETDRKPYDEKAATDKKRYEEEKAKYAAVSGFPNTLAASIPLTYLRYRPPKRKRSRPKLHVAIPDCTEAGVCVFFR